MTPTRTPADLPDPDLPAAPHGTAPGANASTDPAPAGPAPAGPALTGPAPAATGPTPNTARPSTPAPSDDGPPPPKVRLASPDALLAVVPNLLGFHPSRSLVVLGLSGPRDQISLTFRYDLPDPADDDLAADIAAHASDVMARQGIPAVILIGYGPAGLVQAAAGPVLAALDHAGLGIRHALRAENGRYWSLACMGQECCPDEGTPFDPCSHPAAAVLDEAGLRALPDRAALARTLQPPPGTARATRQSTTRALRRLGRLVTAAQRDGRDPAAAVAEAGRGTVGAAIRRYRGGAVITDRGRLASLAVAVSDLRVRDDAWARMDPAHVRAHLRLWTDVVTGAAPEFVPAPAALLAFAAWQAGEGALANVAAERALAADPAYSMALLVIEAVAAGLPPSAARLPMTPAEVAQSYDAGW